ncbi:hypothetical protein GCM10023197_05780 [Gordonia humi]
MPDTTAALDRRELICDAAIGLAAAGGNRAVTHSGIDRTLALPKGSVSYYFRTRRALLSATLARLTARSATAFDAASADTDPAETIGRYLADLFVERADDVRARFALASDAAHDHELAVALRDCLFSSAAAVALFTALGSPTPEDDAADLLVFCEGTAATVLFSGRTPSADEIASAVRRRFGF